MRRTTLLTCGAALVALMLSGCGSAPGQNSGANGFGSGTADGNGSFAKLADGIKEKRGQNQSAHLKLTIVTGGASINAEGDVLFGDQPAMEMTMSLPESAAVSMRLVDDVAYVSFKEGVLSGKPWIKVDTEGGDPDTKTFGGAVALIRTTGDPAQMVTPLAQSGNITGKTTETVRGEETTHYTVTVNVKKAAENQKDPDLKKMMEGAATAGETTFPLELWLNKDELPVRMAIEMPAKDPRTGQSLNTKVTVDYMEWGKPVSVTAPPASEVG